MTVKKPTKKATPKKTTPKKTSEDLFDGIEEKDTEAVMTPEQMSEAVKNSIPVDDRNVIIDPNRPHITSPQWKEYVMGFFEPDELAGDNPKVAGLRRVAELLIGEIKESGPVSVIASTSEDSPGRATVTSYIKFANGSVFSDVADAWHGNTEDMFAVFPAAMASTRAEGRALRKALRLSVVAAEELTTKDTAEVVKQLNIASQLTNTVDGTYQPDEAMTDQQKTFIDIKCKQFQISGEGIFKHVGEQSEDKKPISSHGEVTKQQAASVIAKLTEYQRDTSLIPESILGYTKGWNE